MPITELHEIHERRRSRNIGVGLCLGAFVLLAMGLSIVKVAPQVFGAAAERAAIETSTGQ